MKDFLHHLFIPRESNNHRPRILHYEIIFLIIGILVSGLITIAGTQREYPAVLGISSSITVTDLLKDTNEKRQEQGMAPLTLNTQLSTAAGHKAKDMFAHNYWAHVSPDGTTPWVFIKDSGYQYLYAGENLARGFTTSEDVVNAWMASPSHRENLLSPNYSDIGFAIDEGSLTGSDTILVVQMFGSQSIPKATSDIDQEPVIQGSSVMPTITPSPTPAVIAKAEVNQPQAFAGVAAIQNKPLIDTSTLKRNTSFFVLLLFIIVLLVDAIIIERKKIARVFSHNIDHALFLLFILLAGILIGRGVIL